jgi:hypothetical protein
MASKNNRPAIPQVSYYSSFSARHAARRQRNMLFLASLLYVCAPGAFYAAKLLAPLIFPAPAPPDPGLRETPLIAPVQQLRRDSEKKDSKLTEPKPEEVKEKIEDDPPSELPPVDVSEVHIPGSMSLDYQDPKKCLDQVLAKFSGYVGFAPVNDPDYITNKFDARDWASIHLGGKESVQLYDPALKILDPYGFVDTLRAKYHLPAPQYVAYALFPDLDDKARDVLRTTVAASGLGGTVASAQLVLDPLKGVRVLLRSIVMAPVHGSPH